ncbi:MAG: AMP-binding protein, partial [Proteobacteria bacterium]|nr:AMP-binding protein [Pseudomonadota bacterium]
MTVAAFLDDLRRRGVSLTASGETLTLRAPKGVLLDDERERLRSEKAAILDCLRSEAAAIDDGAPFPLTDIQQAYLIGRAAELELGRVGCHAYREFDCTAIDLPRLEAAWNRLVARHPMLRAVFTEDGRQRILPEVPSYKIELQDLGADPDPQATLLTLREARSHRVFDPERWPLFEITATRIGERIRMAVGIDLLVADAAALITLFWEWGALYEHPERALPPIAGRFSDHARHLPQPSPSDRAYWEPRLDTLPPGPDLPRLPLAGPPRFVRRSLRLDAPRWRALKQASARHGLTISAVVAAVYADILAAWNRRSHFSLILTQFAAPEGMQGVVGDFTSTILLEVDQTGATFLDRARAVQRRLLADLDHAGMSGVAVLRDLRRRRPDVEPVTVVFTSALGHPGLDPEAPSPLAWLGRTVFAITQTPQVAMDHHVFEEDGALVASWDVIEALFPAGVVDSMVEAYGALLESLASGNGWSGGVTLRTRDRAPLLSGPPPALLHGEFLRQARETPTRAAVIAPDRTLDYVTLDQASTRLAGRIATALGGAAAARDRLVAIEEPKGWRQIIAVLAVLKAGAAYLPVDPSLPAERRRLLIDRGEALQIDPEWISETLDGPLAELAPAVDPSSLAYVIYTSGSTGEPKGVMIEHRAAVTTVAEINRRWAVGADDRVLGLSSLSFDLSVYDIFGPLSV